MLTFGKTVTSAHGITEQEVTDGRGKHYALLSQNAPRAWWTIDLWNDGNIARSNKAFPRRFRSLAAAQFALRETWLDAVEGKRHQKFLSQSETKSKAD